MHRESVIIAVLLVTFCNYGILQSYGSLFTATIEKFAENRGRTSLVHSVLIGTSLGGGIIGGYLIRRINLIVVSALGSVLLPLGFMISYWAFSVTYLTCSIGLVAGIGISFTYVSAVVALGTVTPEKHRTTVLSLQNVACGLPGVVLPYLFTWLTTTYGLLGTFLIYGGLTLNNISAAIMFSEVTIKNDVLDVQELNCDLQTTDSRNVNQKNCDAHMSLTDKHGNHNVHTLSSPNKTHDNCYIKNMANSTETHANSYVQTMVDSTVTHDNCNIKTMANSTFTHDNCNVKTVNNLTDTDNNNDEHTQNNSTCLGYNCDVQTLNNRNNIRDNRMIKSDDNIETNIETDETEYQIEDSMPQSHTMTYILFAIAESLVMGNIGGFQTIYQDVGVFKVLSAQETVTCIVIYNVTSTASRFMPLVFHRFTGNPFITPIVASVFGLSGQALLRLTSQYNITLIGYAFSGIADGGISASVSVVIFKILNKNSQAVGFGLTLTFIGIMVACSGPLYGAIFDQTESYALVLNVTTSIFALGLIMFIGCFISYGSSCFRSKRNVK